MSTSGAGGRTTTQTLLDAVLAVSSHLDLHSVLDTIVVSCCEISGARYGFLGVLGENGELVDYVVHGLSDDEIKELVELPAALGLIGHLIRHPDPVRLARVSDHPAEADLPVPHAPMDSFLGVPLRVGDAVFGNIYLTEKCNGEQFTAEDEAMVVALARAAGVAVDHARAYQLSEHRREFLEATSQIAETLHPPFDFEDTLQQIVAGVRRVAHASAAAVVRGRAGQYAVTAAEGPRYSSLVSELASYASDLALAQGAGELRTLAYGEEGTLVVVPFQRDLSYEGLLLLLLDTGRGWVPPADRELLEAYASQASLALDRAQEIAGRHQQLLIADRDRIARDLHDLVIQRLFATGLQLQGARQITDVHELRPRLDAAVADLDNTIRDIRTAIFELAHGPSDTLRANVGMLVRDYAPALGFQPELAISGPVDSFIDEPLAEQVLAVLREALSNCARHALATSCAVRLDVDPDWLVLTVRDNGVGCGEDVHESGLRNLRRRAADLGGQMSLSPAQPHGLVLEWRVPVRA